MGQKHSFEWIHSQYPCHYLGDINYMRNHTQLVNLNDLKITQFQLELELHRSCQYGYQGICINTKPTLQFLLTRVKINEILSQYGFKLGASHPLDYQESGVPEKQRWAYWILTYAPFT